MSFNIGGTSIEYFDLSSINNEVALKKQYRKLASKHHPDNKGNEEIFKKITEEYKKIRDNQLYIKKVRDKFSTNPDIYNNKSNNFYKNNKGYSNQYKKYSNRKTESEVFDTIKDFKRKYNKNIIIDKNNILFRNNKNDAYNPIKFKHGEDESIYFQLKGKTYVIKDSSFINGNKNQQEQQKQNNSNTKQEQQKQNSSRSESSKSNPESEQQSGFQSEAKTESRKKETKTLTPQEAFDKYKDSKEFKETGVMPDEFYTEQGLDPKEQKEALKKFTESKKAEKKIKNYFEDKANNEKLRKEELSLTHKQENSVNNITEEIAENITEETTEETTKEVAKSAKKLPIKGLGIAAGIALGASIVLAPKKKKEKKEKKTTERTQKYYRDVMNPNNVISNYKNIAGNISKYSYANNNIMRGIY